ncbi:MAG: hypothetical protein J7J34_06505 [Thermoplasmata archaeon]|nr:hypothetical protein [Thermoplasmata archaeon]
MAGRRSNPISELTRTLGIGSTYWIRMVVYAMFALFVLFFVMVVWILLS